MCMYIQYIYMNTFISNLDVMFFFSFVCNGGNCMLPPHVYHFGTTSEDAALKET